MRVHFFARRKPFHFLFNAHPWFRTANIDRQERDREHTTPRMSVAGFQCRGLCQGYKCYIPNEVSNPPEQQPALCSREHSPSSLQEEKMFSSSGLFVSLGVWGREAGRKCWVPQSLSKNTRSVLGRRAGRLSDSFPTAKRKIAEIPCHSHSERRMLFMKIQC